MAAAKRVLRYLCSTSSLGLVLGGRSPVVLTGHADVSWVDDLATQRSSQGYTFGLGSGSVSWRSIRSSSVLSSSYEAEIYAGAMAVQELRWLTYLLTDLGEPPRSPPILYIDNKAMLALCREHRLEHRTKHIALCYFLCSSVVSCALLTARCACRRVASAVSSSPVAPAVPSRRPCRRIAPVVLSRPVALTVPSRCPLLSLLSRRVAPSILSRPVLSCLVLSCPVARAPCALPIRRAVCALPVRRAPATPCPSVAPRAPCSTAPVAPVLASRILSSHVALSVTPYVGPLDV
ncbi:unnamed protein product [Closterium sp. NIES-54]